MVTWKSYNRSYEIRLQDETLTRRHVDSIRSRSGADTEEAECSNNDDGALIGIPTSSEEPTEDAEEASGTSSEPISFTSQAQVTTASSPTLLAEPTISPSPPVATQPAHTSQTPIPTPKPLRRSTRIHIRNQIIGLIEMKLRGEECNDYCSINSINNDIGTLSSLSQASYKLFLMVFCGYIICL